MLTIMQKTWAHVQPRRAYPVYVSEFDRLQPDDVVWEPYTLDAGQPGSTRAFVRLHGEPGVVDDDVGHGV